MRLNSAFVLLLMLFATPARADLIVNGSFEQGDFAAPGDPAFQVFSPRLFATLLVPGSQRMTGWDVFLSPFDPDGQMTQFLPTAVGLEWAHSLDASIDGFRNVDLNRGGDLFGIRQTVPVVSGQEYELSYWALTGLDIQGVPLHGAPLRIELNGNLLALDSTPASNVNVWLPFSHRFLATSGLMDISLVAAGRGADPGSAPVIDNVSLRAVPEPCGAVALLLSSVLFGCHRRRTGMGKRFK